MCLASFPRILYPYPMADKKEAPPSYFKKLLSFYFAPAWQSFFTILYLVFFAYFAVFHSGKILVALSFLTYTFIHSSSILTLDYLFWGVTFIISLIIPFSLSIYAIVFFYEVWKDGRWFISHRALATTAVVLGIPLVMILMDDIIRTAGGQSALADFVRLRNLHF